MKEPDFKIFDVEFDFEIEPIEFKVEPISFEVEPINFDLEFEKSWQGIEEEAKKSWESLGELLNSNLDHNQYLDPDLYLVKRD